MHAPLGRTRGASAPHNLVGGSRPATKLSYNNFLPVDSPLAHRPCPMTILLLPAKGDRALKKDTSYSRGQPSSRRDFLKSSASTAVGAGLAASWSGAANVHAAGNDVIRVGLIGCGRPRGGRGGGARGQCLN